MSAPIRCRPSVASGCGTASRWSWPRARACRSWRPGSSSAAARRSTPPGATGWRTWSRRRPGAAPPAPGEEIDDLVESMGAELGVGVDEDASYLGLSAPVEALAALPRRAGRRRRGPVLPGARSWRGCAGARWPRWPTIWTSRGWWPTGRCWRRPTTATPTATRRRGGRGTCRARRRAESLAFHGRHYGTRAAILVVVGPVEARGGAGPVEARFGRWRGAAAGAAGAPPPAAPPGGACWWTSPTSPRRRSGSLAAASRAAAPTTTPAWWPARCSAAASPPG